MRPYPPGRPSNFCAWRTRRQTPERALKPTHPSGQRGPAEQSAIGRAGAALPLPVLLHFLEDWLAANLPRVRHGIVLPAPGRRADAGYLHLGTAPPPFRRIAAIPPPSRQLVRGFFRD